MSGSTSSRAVRLVTRGADLYRALMMALGSAGLFAMMLIVCAQIFCRYVLGFSLVWSEELCRAILVWITFLFAGLALERGEMIAVDGFVRLLPRPLQIVLLLAGGGAALWIVWTLVWLGYDYAVFNAGQVLAALQVSQFWVYLALPVGMALFGIHLALRLAAQVGLIATAGGDAP